tara:strand:+ start:1168 stop:1605 length:438 start_codon:yes stop_codon:yes gene_type:complete
VANVKTYETLFILDSNHYARDPGGVSKQLEELVAEAGGEVLVSRMWMEQKLAYPIDKHQKGTYYLIYFSMDGPNLPKLARSLTLNESVIRELTIRLDPRLVEPILANARGEHFTGPHGDDAADLDGDDGSDAADESSDEPAVADA